MSSARRRPIACALVATLALVEVGCAEALSGALFPASQPSPPAPSAVEGTPPESGAAVRGRDAMGAASCLRSAPAGAGSVEAVSDADLVSLVFPTAEPVSRRVEPAATSDGKRLIATCAGEPLVCGGSCDGARLVDVLWRSPMGEGAVAVFFVGASDEPAEASAPMDLVGGGTVSDVHGTLAIVRLEAGMLRADAVGPLVDLVAFGVPPERTVRRAELGATPVVLVRGPFSEHVFVVRHGALAWAGDVEVSDHAGPGPEDPYPEVQWSRDLEATSAIDGDRLRVKRDVTWTLLGGEPAEVRASATDVYTLVDGKLQAGVKGDALTTPPPLPLPTSVVAWRARQPPGWSTSYRQREKFTLGMVAEAKKGVVCDQRNRPTGGKAFLATEHAGIELGPTDSWLPERGVDVDGDGSADILVSPWSACFTRDPSGRVTEVSPPADLAAPLLVLDKGSRLVKVPFPSLKAAAGEEARWAGADWVELGMEDGLMTYGLVGTEVRRRGGAKSESKRRILWSRGRLVVDATPPPRPAAPKPVSKPKAAATAKPARLPWKGAKAGKRK